MTFPSVGDLATSTFLRSQNTTLQSRMESLIQELASGQVSVRNTALGGSYRAISGLEQSLSRLDALDLASAEAGSMADAMQDAIGAIQTTTETLSIDLLAAGASGTSTHANALVGDATQDFEATVARLNASFAGRTLFGGTATDTPAIADPDAILTSLRTAAATETTAIGIASIVEAWFAPGGGFDTTPHYLGATDSLAPMQVGGGKAVELNVTAADSEIRDTLSGLAMAALIGTSAISGSVGEQTTLAKLAGDKLLNATQDLLAIRAQIGAQQETIEDAQTESRAERNSLDLALAELMSVDPYDRATQLEQVESQIELLYALTVRSSNLKLTSFLR